MSHCHECGVGTADPNHDDTPFQGLCDPCALEEHAEQDADRRLTAHRYRAD